MATGLVSEFEQDSWLDECLSCELEDHCLNHSCEGRIWVAPCGSFNYADGTIIDPARFCEPENVTSMEHTDNSTEIVKQFRGCKKSRRLGMPDFSFTLGWDICQSDPAQVVLLGRCSFDYIIVPMAKDANFVLTPNPHDLKTKAFWGRAAPNSGVAWSYPDDDAQNTSRTFSTDQYCWETKIAAFYV